MAVQIPKRMAHIWIGNRPAPSEWLATWPEKHPDWDYCVYDNDYLTGRKWRFQSLITEYFARKAFAGVSDLMRYELLFEQGGFMPEADSLCLRNTDELWQHPTLYSVWENEVEKPGYMTPFLASVPEHPFVKTVIRRLRMTLTPETLRAPWQSVGNIFLGKLYAKRQPEMTVLPSHYFNPTHFQQAKRGESNATPESYAEQLWGTTRRIYPEYDADTADQIWSETLEKLRRYL